MARTTTERLAVAIGAAGFAIAFTACDNASESGIERLIESQGGGDVDLDLDGDGGFSVQTEEGGMSIDEDGNFVITDADGSVMTGNADAESGEFTIESEEGSFTSGSTSELPEDWPSVIPTPDGMTITTASSMETTDGTAIQLYGSSDDPASFVADYTARLESSGFTAQADATYDNEENWAAVYENSSYTVVLNVVAFEGETPAVGVSVYSSPPE